MRSHTTTKLQQNKVFGQNVSFFMWQPLAGHSDSQVNYEPITVETQERQKQNEIASENYTDEKEEDEEEELTNSRIVLS
jgi:hypothetical protein